MVRNMTSLRSRYANFLNHQILICPLERHDMPLECEKCGDKFKTHEPWAWLGGVVRYLCRKCAQRKARKEYRKSLPSERRLKINRALEKHYYAT